MPGRSTIEAIHLMRQIIEYDRARKKTWTWFLLTWKSIRQVTKRSTLVDNDKEGISKKYINIVQDMYQDIKTNIKTCEKVIDYFNHKSQLPSSRLGPKPLSFC